MLIPSFMKIHQMVQMLLGQTHGQAHTMQYKKSRLKNKHMAQKFILLREL